MQKTLLATATATLLASTSLAQQTLIAQESFDYPAGSDLGNQAGGTGWQNQWWSGNNGDDAYVDAPGFDPIGNKCITRNEDAGSYRIPDVTSFTGITDSMGRIGADGASIWVSFWCQRPANSTDQYGGFSFNELLVAEKLFIGETYQSGLWGIDEPGVGAVNIPGSDPSVLTRFVVRVDHMPGPERLRVWLSPAQPHPSSTADLDVMVGDFAWNEVRLQSGQNNMGMTAFYFDDLVVEKEGGAFPSIGTQYCNPAVVNSLGVPGLISATGVDFAGGQPLFLSATSLPLNQFCYFITARTQGFLPMPGGSDGNLCLGAPFGRFNMNVLNSGGMGEVLDFSVDTNNMPMNPNVPIVAGETWNFQLWYRDFFAGMGATSNFTDGVSILFQ